MTAIDPTRWKELQTAFAEVVELPEEKRHDYLHMIGTSDPELRQAVELLLRGDAEVSSRLARIGSVLRTGDSDLSAQSADDLDPFALSGRMIAHFRVLGPIAAGGMGVVYRAEDTRLGRIIALKLPRRGDWFGGDARDRFMREARAAGALDHPNVCTVHDVGETDDGHPYIAMPLYSGETLAARIAREGPLPVPTALSIARAIARGLGAAHAAGIIHRDVKPANVMLLPDGSVKVLDFGLAKPTDVDITSSNATLGTIAYMSPEQLAGAALDARTDLWSFGILLYEMLTGQRPFAGRDMAVISAIANEKPPRLCDLRPAIPPAVDAVVRSLLEKDRERRPATAEAVDAALAAAELEQSAPARVGPGRRSMTTRKQVFGAFAVSLLVLTGAAALVSRRSHESAKQFVVVADFDTSGPDTVLADVMSDVTRRALSDSRSLGAAPEGRMLAARQRLGMPANARLTLPLARQLALGEGLRGVIAGSLKASATGYVVSLQLVSASSGEKLATAEQAGVPERVLVETLDTLTRRLRKYAGDDEAAIRSQPPLLALTSTSLQAMTDYLAAVRLPPDSTERAVALLREAVALDSSFASALWRLAFAVASSAHPPADAERRELLGRAWAHRGSLTHYEQLRVEIAYRYSPNGTAPDHGRHIEYLRRLVDQYPNAADAKILADMYFEVRDLAGAERMYRLVIALDSMRADGYEGVATMHLAANRLRSARRAVDVLTHKFPGLLSAAELDARVCYAEGRVDRAREILRDLAGSSGQDRIYAYIQIASLDLLDGHLAAWRRTLRAKDSLVGSPSSARVLRRDRLYASYWVLQQPDLALRGLDSVFAGTTAPRSTREAEYYAQFGKSDAAKAIMAARGGPSRRSVYWSGTDTLSVYAWIDLAEGRPRDAAAKFRASVGLLGGTAPSQTTWDAETGVAFERAGMADSAIVVYEHYLNAAPSLEADALKLVWVLEHVAPLYERRKDRRAARAAYGRIAALWKDADPELQSRVSHARERATALR